MFDLFLRPALFESLLAGLPACVFSLRRADFALLSVSEGAASPTGFEARDLLASPFLFISRLHRKDRDRFDQSIRSLEGGAFADDEIRFLGADGRYRWLGVRVTPAPGPPGDLRAVAGMAWATEDLRTARRTAFQGVSILQSAGAAIFFADTAGRVRLWNGECEKLLGWPRQEIVGRTLHPLFPSPPEGVDTLLRDVREQGAVTRDLPLRRRSGEEVDACLTLSLVRDEEGRPAGMVGHVAGTAERRGLENRLGELVARLRTIMRINRIIASDWDLRRVHGEVAAELRHLLDFDRTSIVVFEDGKDPVLIGAFPPHPGELGEGTPLPFAGSAPGWVYGKRMTRIDGDIEASEERFAEDAILLREGMRSRLMIPLFVGEHIVGALAFNSRRRGAFSLQSVEDLGTIPDQLGLAIEKYLVYARLRDSEAKYRRLFEEGPPAATLDRDGRFVDVNEGCLRLYGYSREEFLRLSHGDIAADPGEPSPHAAVLGTGRPLEAEVRRRKKDGTVFWGLLDVFPASDGLVLEQIVDVTPRKEAEMALRREKDFSSGILEVANALIVVLDREGRILLFNRKCEEVTGWKEEEVRGRFIWDALIPERFIEPFRDAFLRLGAPDAGPAAEETPWRTREGRERLVLWNTSVVRDERGDLLWVIGAGMDTTEQRELEDRLRQAQKMEAIGTLAGGIAHDFNNIIQTILGYAALMRQRPAEPGDLSDAIDAVEHAGLRAAELTSQLLGIARGGKVDTRPTDINAVVERVVSMISHTFDRSIAIRKILAPELRSVEGDPGQLEHVLLNLCINARDAMPEGGVLLVETQNERVSPEEARRIAGVRGAPPAGFASLSVTDTGTGIDPKDLPRIFEPFYTTKELGKGSGMGLAMAYGIVKNHGGLMDVRSTPGVGTTFRILLPATSAVPAEEAGEGRAPAAGGSETILFVDDEEPLRLLAVEALGRLGYRVLTARNGAEAVEVCTRRRAEIDLVILDLIMPGMGGEEALRRIRAADPEAKVIVSSGYAVEGKPGGPAAERGIGFLRKPYRLAALAAAVRKALDA